MSLDPNSQTPQVVGHYKDVTFIGAGGLGVVYKAIDTRLNRTVALKVPRADFADDVQTLSDMLREAQIGAQIAHPNICQVYTCEVYDGTPHLVMQYVVGRTLSEFRKIPWLCPGVKEAVDIVKRLANALAALHECPGLPLHLDIKPDNVRVTPKREPVLIDFGLSLRLNSKSDELPARGTIRGTLNYMPPEQILVGFGPLCQASDVYSLGAILYELLTGVPPFQCRHITEAMIEVINNEPVRPSKLNMKVGPALDEICMKALAKSVDDRFHAMPEFAEKLDRADWQSPGWLSATSKKSILQKVFSRLSHPSGHEVAEPAPSRPLVPRKAIRFAFAEYGEVAPPDLDNQNRLFLDVGNDLRPGVIDFHQAVGNMSTAHMIENRLDLIDDSVAVDGADEFTIVLHKWPDLDSIVSAHLAVAYLTTRELPADIRELVDYVDRVDAGYPGMSQWFPFTLYAAQQQLLARPKHGSDVEHWNRAVEDGIAVVDYVLHQIRAGQTIDRVDAFTAPGLFVLEDRARVTDDLQRYQAKLADRETCARVARMRLPGQIGGEVELDVLLVRNVQNANDPARVQYFKIWARGDTERSAAKKGFQALSVFSPNDGTERQHCILSVTPGSEASLRGLGAILDQAEEAARIRIYGRDDRKVDPISGLSFEPRRGGAYNNSDPWYDGRSHGFTIVDAPRRGTVLNPETIERIFLEFGKGVASPL